MDQYNPKVIQDFIDVQFEQALPTFLEYLSIPSQSRAFDPEYLTNGLLLKSAQLMHQWILQQGLQNLTLEFYSDEGFSPFIFGEVKGTAESDQTVLFYGHMDKQPPMDGWKDGLSPYVPKIVDGKLFARGGADDGYSVFGTVLAIKACQQFGIKHPRIVMLFEADEESGSNHIYHYLEKLKEKIGEAALVICLDSSCGNYEQLWFTSTLRGIAECTLTVSVLTEGVHSGDASGVVPSSFRIARLLLDRLENSRTGEVNPLFNVVIPGQGYAVALKSAEALGPQLKKKFPYHNLTQPVSQDEIELYLNRAWRPQLCVIGADNIPKAQSAGNVLRPKTTLKLSIRLPPTFDVNKAGKILTDLLTTDVPYCAQVSVDDIDVSQGWICPENQPFVSTILEEASQIYFGKPLLGENGGGCIPLMNTLHDLYPKSQFIVTGVLGPGSNAHGPNEFLDIPYTKKLICCITHFLAKSYPNFAS